jgi:hypothetical protein
MSDLSQGVPSGLQSDVPQRQEAVPVQNLRQRILPELRFEKAHAEAPRHPQHELAGPSQPVQRQQQRQQCHQWIVEQQRRQHKPQSTFAIIAIVTQPRQFESSPIHVTPATPENFERLRELIHDAIGTTTSRVDSFHRKSVLTKILRQHPIAVQLSS